MTQYTTAVDYNYLKEQLEVHKSNHKIIFADVLNELFGIRSSSRHYLKSFHTVADLLKTYSNSDSWTTTVQTAKIVFILIAPHEKFPDELKLMQQHRRVDNKSSLKRLLNPDGVLEVGGRQSLSQRNLHSRVSCSWSESSSLHGLGYPIFLLSELR